MGEMHKKSLEGVKLEGQWPVYILILALIWPGISTIIAGLIQKDEAKQNEIIKVGLIQWLTAPFCVGWIWAIKWALELKKQSV